MSSFREPLSAQAICAALSRVPIVREVVYLPSAGSTNAAARDLAETGAPHATLVVTDEQTAGRGRMGRSWYMPPRSALAMSILVRPELNAAHANRLTMLASLAAAEGIEQATGLSVKLKWPNDVVAMNNDQWTMNNDQWTMSNDQWTMTDDQLAMINDQLVMINGQWSDVRKMGGILCESAIVGDRIDYAVVGIGLNVNVDFADRPELAATATSVMLQLGRQVDRLSVLAAVVSRFAERFDSLYRGDALREAWAARLVTLGRRVEARSGEEVRTGLAEGVDDDGALLLRTGDGMLHRLLAADVTPHL